jgi:chemotaxis protein methyltransferase CheR
VSLAIGGPAFSDADYRYFVNHVERKLQIRLGDYKPDQMKRRLQTLAEKHGAGSFALFAQMIDKDSNVCIAFLDTMTINVTELFRNPDLFKTLQNEVLPPILQKRGGGSVDVWSAGCSYGAEAFTLAVILHELLPAGNFKVKGTDIDLSVLAKANNPSFNAMDMQNVTPERKQKFFTTFDDKTYMPKLNLKQKVSFGRGDLLADTYPREAFDMILCRNVVIYFNDEAKERIFQGFFHALRPGGVLFVGGTERLNDHGKMGFSLLRPFFYQKPAQEAVRRLAA